MHSYVYLRIVSSPSKFLGLLELTNYCQGKSRWASGTSPHSGLSVSDSSSTAYLILVECHSGLALRLDPDTGGDTAPVCQDPLVA